MEPFKYIDQGVPPGYMSFDATHVGKICGTIIYDPVVKDVSDEIEKTGLYRDGLGKIHKFPEDKPDNQRDRQYIFEAICKRREKALKNLHNMRVTQYEEED